MKKLYVLLSFLFLLFTLGILYQIMFREKEKYQMIYENKTNVFVKSLSTPRGRILDCHGKVLVDNVGIKTIVYRKLNGVTTDKEIEIAYQLAGLLEFKSEASIMELKKFWLLKNDGKGKKMITEEEYRKYEERKLTSNDLYLLKLDRITDDFLEEFTLVDKKAAYIYYLMNKGYYYDAKIIKMDVLEEEYANVLEENISGVVGEMFFKRDYPYGNILKSLFGSVGNVPKELESTYLNQGYALDDIVGISYLEKEYDSYLRGEKATYKVGKEGTLQMVEEGKKGNDLYLSIDIDMQLGIEEILKEEIKKGKKLPNTEYYNGSYVLVGDTKSGAIKAVVGLKYVGNDVFVETESDVVNSSFTVGSVVKGASMAMGYQNNLIEVGRKIKDACVKLYLVPEKCSYKSLGYVDDITALKTSSNYYQFLLAMKLAGQSYSYNMKMDVSAKEFLVYRDVFAQFGLGVETGIDLPKEVTGIKGTTIAPDLLLNFAIGQYDTYTPIQLLQYMSTIANDGKRMRLSLMDKIVNGKGEVIANRKEEILNTFSLDSFYFDRIKTGLYQVVNVGTGYGYTDSSFKPAGKTGTSETYFDKNQDGKGDVLTITNTYAMYAPFDDPKYTMVTISPHVSHYEGRTDAFAYINRYISKAVSDYVFTNF